MDVQRLDPADRDMIIRTVIGEAAGQPPEGQAAVAHVIKNRVADGSFGKSVEDVLLAPRQFEPWETRFDELTSYAPTSPAYQRAARIVDGVYDGSIEDGTEGATHFANRATVAARGNTKALGWIDGMSANGPVTQIGAHTFGRANAGKVTKVASANPLAGFTVVDDAEDYEEETTPAPVVAPKSKPEPANPLAGFTVVDDEGAATPGALQVRVGGLKPAAAPATFDERFGAGLPTARGGSVTFPEREGDLRPDDPFVPSAMTDPALAGKLREGMQAKADERLVGEAGAGNAALAALYRAGNTLGLNLPRNAAAGIATGLGAIGVPGYDDSFDRNYQKAHDQEDALARQHPVAAAAGTVGGIVGAIPVLPALPAPAALGFGGRIAANAATGAGYGALAEGVDRKTLGAVGEGATIGGLAGAGGTVLIEKALAPIASRLFNRFLAKPSAAFAEDGSFTPEAAQLLTDAGLDPAALAPEVASTMREVLGQKGASPAAVREALGKRFGIDLTEGQAGGDFGQQQFEAIASRGGYGDGARGAIRPFLERQGEQIADAKAGIGRELAGGRPVIDNPLDAGELVAAGARARSDAAAFGEAAGTKAADDAARGLRGRTTIDAVDAGGTVTEAVRAKAAEAKAAYQGAYGDVAKVEGQFAPGALERVGTRVRERLGPEYPIDDVVTPAANRALADLDNIGGVLKIEEGAHPTLRDVDQFRKRLIAYSRAAKSNEDRRAMRGVLDQFDQHVEDVLDLGLFGKATPREAAPAAASEPAPLQVPVRADRPETLIQFLGREGGIALDGDARAGDLQRTMTGFGPLARRGGRSLDDLRPRLIEEGFLPPDADGGVARNIGDEVFEAIRRERQGQPTYRLQDRDRAAAFEGARGAGADEHFGQLVDDATQRLVAEHEAVGVRARDLDQAHVRAAAEAMVRGEHTDPLAAYEASIMAGPRPTRAAPAEAPPAPELPAGEGVPAADGFPGGADRTGYDRLRQARSLFRDYQQTFKPRGPGDDVGRAMQKLVETDAQPHEVANMLYGAAQTGSTGLSVRLTDRLRTVLGKDSEGWAAVQQGLIAKVLGTGDHASASTSIDKLFTGPGRVLAQRVLTSEQLAGLRSFQRGVSVARQAREDVPAWVQDVAKGGFNPQAVVNDLIGAGTPGTKASSADFARAVQGFFGKDSAEWSAVRQAAWLRLTSKAEGVTEDFQSQALANRIAEFLRGKGKRLAETLYTPEERATMGQFGQLMAAVTPQRGASPNSDTAPALGSMLQKAAGKSHMIGAMLGMSMDGGAGALAGFGVSKLLGGAGARLTDRGNTARALAATRGAGVVKTPPPAVPTEALGRRLAPLGAVVDD